MLGIGTAMVYPTLLAAIGDVAHPTWRARSVGIYRLWRDGGFAVGALLAGIVVAAPHIRVEDVSVAAIAMQEEFQWTETTKGLVLSKSCN